MIFEIISYFSLLVGFVVASIFDVRYRMIPMWTFPISCSIFVLGRILTNEFDLSISIGYFVGFFVFYYVLAKLDQVGGGDVIMMSLIGYSLGSDSIYIMIYIFVFISILVTFLKSVEDKSIPLALFAGMAYVMYGSNRVLFYIEVLL